MRSIRLLVLLGVATSTCATLASADEPPLQMNIQPQMLVLSPAAKIEFRCKLTNTSDKRIAVHWNTPQFSMFPRQINVDMSHGSESDPVELAAGESRTVTLKIQLGDDLPALDDGDYDLAINVATDVDGKRRHMQEKLPLTIVARDGEKPIVTAASIAAAARDFAIDRFDVDKFDVESYRIRRRGNGWDVDLSLRGPKRFGSVTVSLDGRSRNAVVLPIP